MDRQCTSEGESAPQQEAPKVQNGHQSQGDRSGGTWEEMLPRHSNSTQPNQRSVPCGVSFDNDEMHEFKLIEEFKPQAPSTVENQLTPEGCHPKGKPICQNVIAGSIWDDKSSQWMAHRDLSSTQTHKFAPAGLRQVRTSSHDLRKDAKAWTDWM